MTGLETRQGSSFNPQSLRQVPQGCQVILVQDRLSSFLFTLLVSGVLLVNVLLPVHSDSVLGTTFEGVSTVLHSRGRCSADSSRINTVFFVHSGQSWRCQAPGGDLEEGHTNSDTPQCDFYAPSSVDTHRHSQHIAADNFFSCQNSMAFLKTLKRNAMHLCIHVFYNSSRLGWQCEDFSTIFGRRARTQGGKDPMWLKRGFTRINNHTTNPCGAESVKLELD